MLWVLIFVSGGSGRGGGGGIGAGGSASVSSGGDGPSGGSGLWGTYMRLLESNPVSFFALFSFLVKGSAAEVSNLKRVAQSLGSCFNWCHAREGINKHGWMQDNPSQYLTHEDGLANDAWVMPMFGDLLRGGGPLNINCMCRLWQSQSQLQFSMLWETSCLKSTLRRMAS